ncbi:unnamed protein product [Amoebophrya sp. A120]|nr:unnamed protein product [Amoebophrya sp. A120]|eukprot:GSA120T00017734001.1
MSYFHFATNYSAAPMLQDGRGAYAHDTDPSRYLLPHYKNTTKRIKTDFFLSAIGGVMESAAATTKSIGKKMNKLYEFASADLSGEDEEEEIKVDLKEPLVQVTHGHPVPVDDLQLKKPRIDYELDLVRSHQAMVADLFRTLEESTAALQPGDHHDSTEAVGGDDQTSDGAGGDQTQTPPPPEPVPGETKREFARNSREAVEKLMDTTKKFEKPLVRAYLPEAYPESVFDVRPMERLEKRFGEWVSDQENWAGMSAEEKTQAAKQNLKEKQEAAAAAAKGEHQVGGAKKAATGDDVPVTPPPSRTASSGEEKATVDKDEDHLKRALRSLRALRETALGADTGLRQQIRMARLKHAATTKDVGIEDQRSAIDAASDFMSDCRRHQRMFQVKRTRQTDAFEHFYQSLKTRLTDSDADKEKLGKAIDDEIDRMERNMPRVERADRMVVEDLRRIRQLATDAATFL